MKQSVLLVLVLVVCAGAPAQGPDRPRSERDLAVIAELLPGLYANANQHYFERRLKDPQSDWHEQTTVIINRAADAAFALTIENSDTRIYDARLNIHQDLVLMHLQLRDGEEACRYQWVREAMQFRARAVKACARTMPSGLVLSARQLWLYPSKADKLSADNPYRLHRARTFTCYADLPGVGGGRDTPFERYQDLQVHDQGGSADFTTRDRQARNLSVSMLRVDWPMNNAEGVFTRDSLVLYVNEKTGGALKEHGYAFIPPDAERIGINLKWILVNCYMESNATTRPTM